MDIIFCCISLVLTYIYGFAWIQLSVIQNDQHSFLTLIREELGETLFIANCSYYFVLSSVMTYIFFLGNVLPKCPFSSLKRLRLIQQ